MEDTPDSFLGLMECFGTQKTEEPDCHPLNYQRLQQAQEADKTIVKIHRPDNTKYVLQDSMGGLLL